MDDRSLTVLQAELLAELERRERKDPTSFFPWHEIQKWTLNEIGLLTEKDIRVILACGGNRGGKSALGKGIYARFMRRVSPLSRKLRTTDRLTGDVRAKNDRDPVTVWIIPPTLEKARQDWVNPSDGYSIKYWLGDLFVDEKKSPDHVFYSRPPGMSIEEAEAAYGRGDVELFDKTILKSHDQELLSFEASAVDLAIVDEEIMDEAKWNSILMRIGTSNGSVVMCYTPLHGLSWSYDRYWKPLIKLKTARKLGDRRWIHDSGDGACVVAVQFGAGDNPLAADYAREIDADPGMSDAEKAARLFGEYGFVEGALIPALSGLDVLTPEKDHEIYIVDNLPGTTDINGKVIPGSIIEWYLVTDPNKSYGATMTAQDSAGNLFLVGEHLETSWPDRKHAQAFKDIEKKWVRPGTTLRRIADPGSAGAQSIVNMSDNGLFFETAEKGAGSVSEGVKRIRSFAWIDPDHYHPITGRKGAPRIYFHRPSIVSKQADPKTQRVSFSCRTADQISQARQTDNQNAPPDTPHKSNRSKLDLFDCVRYTVMACRVMFGDEEEPVATVGQSDYTLPKLPLHGAPTYNDNEGDYYVPVYDI